MTFKNVFKPFWMITNVFKCFENAWKRKVITRMMMLLRPCGDLLLYNAVLWFADILSKNGRDNLRHRSQRFSVTSIQRFNLSKDFFLRTVGARQLLSIVSYVVTLFCKNTFEETLPKSVTLLKILQSWFSVSW